MPVRCPRCSTVFAPDAGLKCPSCGVQLKPPTARKAAPPPCPSSPFSKRAWAGIGAGGLALILALIWMFKPSPQVPTAAPAASKPLPPDPRPTAPSIPKPGPSASTSPAPTPPLKRLNPLFSIPLPDPTKHKTGPLTELSFEGCRARFRYETGFSALYDTDAAHLENDVSKPAPLPVRIGEKTYFAQPLPVRTGETAALLEGWVTHDEDRLKLYDTLGIRGKPMNVSSAWGLRDESMQFHGYVQSVSVFGPRTVLNELIHLETNGRFAPAVSIFTVYREGQVEARGTGTLVVHEAGGKTYFITIPDPGGTRKLQISTGGSAWEGPAASAVVPIPGTREAVVWKQNQIQIVDLGTGMIARSGEAGGRPVARVIPSPDGARLALLHGADLSVLDSATLKPVFEHRPNGGIGLKHVAWCEKGDHLLFGGPPFRLWDGSRSRAFPMHPDGFNLRWGTLQLAPIPDGTGFLAFYWGTGATPTLDEWRIDDRDRRLLPVSHGPRTASALHPDWILAHTSPQSSVMKLVRLADRSVDHEVTLPVRGPLPLLSPIRIVLPGRNREEISLYDIPSRKWRNLELRQEGHPKGELLGLGGDLLLIREQAQTGGPRTLRTLVWILGNPPRFVRAVEGNVAALSPSGRYLITSVATKPRTVEVAESGERLFNLPAQPWTAGLQDRRHVFSPTERWVAATAGTKLIVGDLRTRQPVAEADLPSGAPILFPLSDDRLAVVVDREFLVYSIAP